MMIQQRGGVLRLSAPHGEPTCERQKKCNVVVTLERKVNFALPKRHRKNTHQQNGHEGKRCHILIACTASDEDVRISPRDALVGFSGPIQRDAICAVARVVPVVNTESHPIASFHTVNHRGCVGLCARACGDALVGVEGGAFAGATVRVRAHAGKASGNSSCGRCEEEKNSEDGDAAARHCFLKNVCFDDAIRERK